MIFVDTGAWYAAYIADDPDYHSCSDLIDHPTGVLVATDYVVDELLTLLTARGHRSVALRIGDDFWNERHCRLVWTTREDVAAAWAVFKSFHDKSWSFTDCVSYAVMKRLGVTQAFSLEDHFSQFGFTTLKP